MTGIRWWHLLVVLATVITTGMILLIPGPMDPGIATPIVLLILAGFLACWFSFGWRSFAEPRIASIFAVVLIVTIGAGTAVSPNTAIMQGIAFPLLWCMTDQTRLAVRNSVALAIAGTIGFYISLGMAVESLIAAVLIELASLALGVGIGLWFTHSMREADAAMVVLAELQAAQESLAEANRDAGAIAERERLATEIHDTIAQSLTSLVMIAQRAKATIPEDAHTHDELESIENIARNALSEARTLVATTSAVSVENGLAVALTRLGANFERETGIAVWCSIGTVAGVHREHEVVLLRCAQETLANVRKHSGASRVTVAVTHNDESVVLEVHDDGVGISDVDAAVDGQFGFGLVGMKRRVELAGGALTVETAADLPGAVMTGTRVRVALPLSTANEPVEATGAAAAGTLNKSVPQLDDVPTPTLTTSAGASTAEVTS